MELALIIPVLVAGFLHCHIDPGERLRLFHYGGQYLYFRSAAMGLRAFAIALIFCLAAHFLLPDQISFLRWSVPFQPILWLKTFIAPLGIENSDEGADQMLQERAAWFCALSIATFAVTIFWSKVANLIFARRNPGKDIRLHVLEKLFRDSPLDKLLLHHINHANEQVMLNMRDRKVYVGSVLAFSEPALGAGDSRTILLLPEMSGYRDEKSLKVNFTTFYDYSNHGAARKVTLALRQDDIISATSFSIELYRAWNIDRPSPSASDPAPNHVESPRATGGGAASPAPAPALASAPESPHERTGQ